MKTIEQILKLFPNTNANDWHQHVNGNGWVQNTAHVDNTAYIGNDAIVYGNANVFENACVFGNARVSGYAQVYENAYVSGNARVYGYARVFGNAYVYENAHVSGNAYVYENAHVSGNANVNGSHRLIGGKFNKSPIYIQGTKYAIFQSSDKTIGIGCKDFDAKISKKKLMEVAENEGFTESEIEEYKRHWLYVKSFVKGGK